MRLRGPLLLLASIAATGAFVPSSVLPGHHSLPLRVAVSNRRTALRCSATSEGTESNSQTRRALLRGLSSAALVIVSGQHASALDDETVLVVGARGIIGKSVVQELISKGKKVRALSREQPEAVARDLPGDIEWVRGDLNKPATLDSEVVEGITRIIYCPGAHAWEDPENNRRVYEEGVQLLLTKGSSQYPTKGLKRFVYLSSSGVAQPGPYKRSFLSQVFKYKRRGEAVLRRSGTPYTVIRTNQVFGEMLFKGMVFSPKSDHILIFPEDDQDAEEPSAVYLPNLATALVGATLDESAAGKTFGVTTLLERSTTRAQDAWMGEIRRVPPDAERRVPWPEDLIETGA